MRRGLAAGLVAGLLGLSLALLGDAVTVYRGLWVYVGLLPGVLGALWFGPGAGLVAGLLTGAAGGSPFVALAAGLWMALVGWLGSRRWPGLTLFLSVPLVLAPLVALGYGLGVWWDMLQVWPLLITLALTLLPTALALGLLGWIGLAAWRRFGRRTVTAAGLLLMVAVALPLQQTTNVGQAAPSTGSGEEVRAAYAAVDISPSPAMLKHGIYMGGYGGRPGPAEAVHDPIWFRVMALEQGSTRLLFVQTDTVGMGNRLFERLRAAAAGTAGTPHVFIGATHTHAGPDLQGLWGGVPAAYEDYLVERLVAAAAEAVEKLEPVELKAGATKLQATRNRRDWGIVPEQMSVLQAVAPDGRVVATLINFAAHPTVLPRENLQLSTDFVGPMLAAVGGPALFFNGAQGDVLPDTSGLTGAPFERAEAFGRQLAVGVEEALGTARTVVPGELSVRTGTAHAPLENWQLALAMALGIVRYDVSHTGLVPGVKTQVSVVRLGPEFTMVTVPGEMMTRLWAGIEQQLPPGQRFVLGLTHDSLGYIIPEDEWLSGRNRNYEESVSLGPVMAGLVERTLARLLR